MRGAVLFLVLIACGSKKEHLPLGYTAIEPSYCVVRDVDDLDGQLHNFVVVAQGTTVSLEVELNTAATVENAIVLRGDPSGIIVISRETHDAGAFSVTFPTDALPPGLYEFRTAAYADGHAPANLTMRVVVLTVLDPNASPTDADGDCLSAQTGDCDDSSATVTFCP